MKWKDLLNGLIARVPPLEEVYVPFRAAMLVNRYRTRREFYAAACRAAGLVYSETTTTIAVRERLRSRGYPPAKRSVGGIHTFAFIPRVSWHSDLYDALESLGPVTQFDYAAMGYMPQELRRGDSRGNRRRAEMNALVVPALRSAHAKQPVDWMFVYGSGSELSAKTIKGIQDEFGFPVVGMCLDDKHSWEGPWMGDHRGLQIDIAPVLDLAWTSARVTCDWYLACGGRPLYLPEGSNPKVYRPSRVGQDIPVSFIGGRYGFRASTIRFLRRLGIPVQVYGDGWGTETLSIEDMVAVFCRSRINLGMGGTSYSEDLTNVKGRDFSIPATGGGVYVTSFSPDLAQHFVIGREIVCYRNRDEMVEMIRYYLAHPDEARAIAQAGRARCLAEHQWLHRYAKVCQVLGILCEDDVPVVLPGAIPSVEEVQSL